MPGFETIVSFEEVLRAEEGKTRLIPTVMQFATPEKKKKTERKRVVWRFYLPCLVPWRGACETSASFV